MRVRVRRPALSFRVPSLPLGLLHYWVATLQALFARGADLTAVDENGTDALTKVRRVREEEEEEEEEERGGVIEGSGKRGM